ncbi:MaoC family dehydratase [Halostella litorea]|uniref:MaoC family dehydratase n=1 Tax=Halostella litorea TaxID=2528831 RepID=UPI00192A4F4B|nr:MaoC family dehydratase [Halostella litorea]
MSLIHFDDVEEGTVRELGSYEVPREEMVAFAERYDPQPIHVDPDVARDSIFGGLIASGWYTASVCMRLFADGFLCEAASMGAIGVDELRWETPVRPGDVLTVENEIMETTASGSRDDRGYVRNQTRAHNGDGDEVLRWTGINIIARE